MSTHTAEVIRVKLEPHPNADSLSLIRVGGFCVVGRTDCWQDGQLAVYIPPDTIVDTRKSEFSFLAGPNPDEYKVRVKVKKLRGEHSMGCLVPAPEGFSEGDDCWQHFELEHYEPELGYTLGGNFAKAPSNWTNLSKYDLENLRAQRYQNLFVPDEEVIVTEKLNGSNIGLVFTDGQMFVRSRSGFRAESDNEFWCIGNMPNIRKWCEANPDHMLYGEVYGHVKGFKYDTGGKVSFRCFDVQKLDRSFLSYDEVFNLPYADEIEYVPFICRTNFNIENLLKLAEEPSFSQGTIKEGIVVRPTKERVDWKYGRIVYKIISNRYLEKS